MIQAPGVTGGTVTIVNYDCKTFIVQATSRNTLYNLNFMLIVNLIHYAECRRYVDSHYAQCLQVECRFAECPGALLKRGGSGFNSLHLLQGFIKMNK